MSKTPPSCIVVGAGFSGLSLAYWAVKDGVRVTLIEEQTRVGGLLQSTRFGPTLVESAANGFLWSDDFAELEKDLDLEFIATRPESRRRYIYRANAFRRWPLNFFETVGFVWRFCTRFFERRPHARESIASWGERVLGSKATRFVLETVLQGIYAGDPRQMSARLIVGRLFEKSSPRQKRRGTHSHPEGMGALALDMRRFLEASGLCELRAGQKFSSEDLRVALASTTPVFLAVPPFRASEILQDLEPHLAEALSRIELRSVAKATIGFPLGLGDQGLPRGFGALFARDQGVNALGVLRNHMIFEGRSPNVSETWIYSGADLKKMGVWGDPERLKALIQKERIKVGGRDLAPDLFQCYFWEQGIPHYTLDLEAFLEREDLRSLYVKRGVEIFGNFKGQLGLSRIFTEAKRLLRERIVNDG